MEESEWSQQPSRPAWLSCVSNDAACGAVAVEIKHRISNFPRCLLDVDKMFYSESYCADYK